MHGLCKVYGIEDFYLIAALFEHLSTLYQHCPLWVSDNIAAVHLHKVGFYEKSRLARTGTADDKDIFIPRILRLSRSARHHQPLRLCQQDIVLKFSAHVRLYVLCIAPPCGTVLHAMPELLGVLGFEIYHKAERNAAPCSYQQILWVETR